MGQSLIVDVTRGDLCVVRLFLSDCLGHYRHASMDLYYQHSVVDMVFVSNFIQGIPYQRQFASIFCPLSAIEIIQAGNHQVR
jgi:hypothetical protein